MGVPTKAVQRSSKCHHVEPSILGELYRVSQHILAVSLARMVGIFTPVLRISSSFYRYWHCQDSVHSLTM